MRFSVKLIALLLLAVIFLVLDFFLLSKEEENVFPLSHQKDGGRAFLDFLRLKGYRVKESYDTLTHSLPNNLKSRLLIVPLRKTSAALRLSEIEPLVNFLQQGNSVVFITRNPAAVLERLKLTGMTENEAERQFLARKDPAVLMAETIRQLLQEGDHSFLEANQENMPQRVMRSVPVTCQGIKSRTFYLLAIEAGYFLKTPKDNSLTLKGHCASEGETLAISYQAFGGSLKFLANGSLLQNRYIAEADNIEFLVDFFQPELYVEILWSEFHNDIFIETNLLGRLLASWQGRFLVFLLLFWVQVALLYSLKIQKIPYRMDRESLSLRGLVYPVELMRRYRKKLPPCR